MVGTMINTSLGMIWLLLLVAFAAVCLGAAALNFIATDGFTYPQQMWVAMGYFIDPGKMAELEPTHSANEMLCASLLMMIGMLWVGTTFGIVIDQISTTMDRWRQSQQMIVASGHLVVLGWSEKTLFLVGELAQMLTDGPDRGGHVVVLGDMRALDMYMYMLLLLLLLLSAECKVAHPAARKRWPRVKLSFWSGKPYEVDDLRRVSVSTARLVVALGPSRSPRVSDSLVLTTLCALQCLPASLEEDGEYYYKQRQGEHFKVRDDAGSSSRRGQQPRVLAELALPQNVAMAETLGGPRTVAVPTRTIVDKVLAISALSPTVGRALQEIMSFVGSQFERVDAARLVQVAEAAGTACTFGWARHRFPRAVVIGVFPSGGVTRTSAVHVTERMALHLAPPNDYTIRETDQLLVVANSFDDANLLLDAPVSLVAALDAGFATLGQRLGKRTRAQPKGDAEKEGHPTEEKEFARLLVSPGGAKVESSRSSEPATAELEGVEDEVAKTASPGQGAGPEPLTVICVGWADAMHSLLVALDERLPARSTILVLSEKSIEWREAHLSSNGLHLDGTPTTGGAGLSNCRLQHLVGFCTDANSLRQLPLSSAAAAIVSAESDEQDAQINDAEVMVSALLLQSLVPTTQALAVIVEFNDVLTRRLIRRRPGLLDPEKPLPLLSPGEEDVRRGVDLLAMHRTYLEAGALSMAVHSLADWRLILALLDANAGPQLCSLPVSHALGDASFIPAGFSASFLELSTRVADRGLGLLLGWRRAVEPQASRDTIPAAPAPAATAAPGNPDPVYRFGVKFSSFSTVLNPPDKAKPLRWSPCDEIIVLTRRQGAGCLGGCGNLGVPEPVNLFL